jgi:murein DD-endopeptidase MepM/ murein hydrolase activator NlpD
MTLQDAAGVKKLPSGHWLSLIALLLPGVASAAALSQRGAALLSPVPSACVSSPFGPRVLPNRPLAGQYHYGIDMPAPAGEAVRAAAPGTVMRIQRKGPGGLEVLVQHDGFVGIYSHLGMVTPSLAEGKSTLAAGEKLGVVGHSGLTYGMHLYFEMLLSGRPVDPAPYLGVPLCNAAYRTRADMIASDGKIPPTRRSAGSN